jgi:hypothetical protein
LELVEASLQNRIFSAIFRLGVDETAVPEPGPLMGDSGIAGGKPGSAEPDAEPDAEPGPLMGASGFAGVFRLGVDETTVASPMPCSSGNRIFSVIFLGFFPGGFF